MQPRLLLSHLDYCNSLLAGIASVHLQHLQSVQNTAARLVSGTRRHDHVTPVLVNLHWLTLRTRQDDSSDVKVPTRWSPEILGRTLCSICFNRRSSTAALCFVQLSDGPTNSHFSPSAGLCCVYAFDLEHTTSTSVINAHGITNVSSQIEDVPVALLSATLTGTAVAETVSVSPNIKLLTDLLCHAFLALMWCVNVDSHGVHNASVESMHALQQITGNVSHCVFTYTHRLNDKLIQSEIL